MSVTLLLGMHADLPYGTPPDRLAQIHDAAYRHVIETLVACPEFRCSLHFPGFLLDWMQSSRKDDFAALTSLARRGQVELFSGGETAPILATLPQRDRVGQLRAANDRLTRATGRAPHGAWTGDSGWTTTIVPALTESDLRYAVIDERHFIDAGIAPERLDGYFCTEEGGTRIDLFPASAALHQHLCNASAPATVAWLEAMAKAGREAIIGFASLAEWADGAPRHSLSEWFRALVDGVLASPAIETAGFGDFHNSRDARGIVYPVPGSGRDSWQTHLARSPAANWLHKRMLQLSARVAALPRRATEIDERLYRIQTGGAYQKNGRYLPQLRREAWRALAELEYRLDRIARLPAIESEDIDLDGHRETMAHDGEWLLAVRDDGLAAAHELTSYPLAHNFADLLPEAGESGDQSCAAWVDHLNDTLLADYEAAGPLDFRRPGIAKRYILIGNLISLQWRFSGMAGRRFSTSLRLVLPDPAARLLVEGEEPLALAGNIELPEAGAIALADDSLGGCLRIAWNEGARVSSRPSLPATADDGPAQVAAATLKLEWDIVTDEFTIALQMTTGPLNQGCATF